MYNPVSYSENFYPWPQRLYNAYKETDSPTIQGDFKAKIPILYPPWLKQTRLPFAAAWNLKTRWSYNHQ